MQLESLKIGGKNFRVYIFVKKPRVCGVKLASGQVLEDSGTSRNDIDLID